MLNGLLKKRNLPSLLSRQEMLNILLREEYGDLPSKPCQISFEVAENVIRHFCAGKAVCNKITAHMVINGKSFSFPFYEALPTKGETHPFFVHINFRDNIPDLYMPTEELIDQGFAVLSFCYNDVTKDNDDLSDGLAGVIAPTGKLAMWAWCRKAC